MPTQEDESRDLDLLNALKADLKERYNKPGNVYLGLVHRLGSSRWRRDGLRQNVKSRVPTI